MSCVRGIFGWIRDGQDIEPRTLRRSLELIFFRTPTRWAGREKEFQLFLSPTPPDTGIRESRAGPSTLSSTLYARSIPKRRWGGGTLRPTPSYQQLNASCPCHSGLSSYVVHMLAEQAAVLPRVLCPVPELNAPGCALLNRVGCDKTGPVEQYNSCEHRLMNCTSNILYVALCDRTQSMA
jgi:hypothetical protein